MTEEKKPDDIPEEEPQEPLQEEEPAQEEEAQPKLKELTPGARVRLNDCFTHATRMASLSSYDYDYANSLFSECVILDPNNIEYIESFLNNLRKKYKDNKKGSRKSSPSRAPFKKAVQKKELLDVLRRGIETLAVNPWDATVLRPLAEACEVLGCVDLELRLLKMAQSAKPKDPEINKHCALTLGRLKQFDQAIACWHKVEAVRKTDREPQDMISALSVAKARQQAGISDDMDDSANISLARGTGVSADVKVPKKEEGRKMIPLTKRQVLERAIAEDPSDIENYAKLSDMLIKEARFADARRVLDRGAGCAEKTDLQDHETIEDAQMRLAKAHWKSTSQTAQMKKTEKLKEMAEQRRETSIQLELEIFQRRAENRPDDLRVMYEYGLRLKQVGQYAEAVKFFQKSRSLPKRKVLSTYELGQCCRLLKQYAQALKCFEATIQIAEEDPPTLRDSLYWSGVILAAMKDYEKAESHLATLVEMKSDYKDVKARLDKVRLMRNNQ